MRESRIPNEISGYKRADDSPRTQGTVAGRTEPEWRSTPIDPPEVSELPKRRVPGPKSVPRLTPDVLELIGLVGTEEVPAVLIPADSSSPITKIKFDKYRLGQYDVARYDLNRVVLTKKNAELDETWPNPLATDYVKNHSDAAKHPDSRLDSPKKVYDDAIVLGYDPLFEMLTGLTDELNELRQTLERIAPFRGFEEDHQAD
jgi:hypothetical protein